MLALKKEGRKKKRKRKEGGHEPRNVGDLGAQKRQRKAFSPRASRKENSIADILALAW